MSVTRRLFFGRAFGAALAAPTAMEQLAQAAKLQTAAMMQGAQVVGSPKAVGYSGTGPLAWALKAARKLYASKDREEHKRRAYRPGGLDHDIYVMGSWSLAYNAAVQRQRDEATESFLEKLRKEAWPSDDD